MSIATLRASGLWGIAAAVGQSPLRYPVLLFLFLRGWTLAGATLFQQWLPVQTERIRLYYGMSPLDPSALGWLFAPWQRWDAIWYTAIAERGYSASDLSTAFFPLYPLLIRTFMQFVPVNSIAAGLAISSAATLGAFVLFFLLIRLDDGEQNAGQALAYLATFPTAFFLIAPYTESLFLLLVLGAWWLARTHKWWLAGGVAGLAALTRPQGVLILLPLAILFFQQCRRGEVKRRTVASLLPTLVGAVAFFFYLIQLLGSPAAWFQIEGKWRQFAWPWEPLWKCSWTILTSGDAGLAFLNLLDLTFTVLFLALLGWGLHRGQYAEAAYLAIIVLPALFAIPQFDPHLPLASMLRFLVVGFPAFAIAPRMRLSAKMGIALTSGQFLLQILLLFLYTEWVFVG